MTLGELIIEIEILKHELMKRVPALDIDIDEQLYSIQMNTRHYLEKGTFDKHKKSYISQIDYLLKDYK